jgi:hypothetical protein
VSDSSLPDDPSQWPDDPHELLGVPRDAGPRDIRKAYTRLIRLYKPERFPEQFRRVRAAYETALRLAEFLSNFGQSGTSATGLPAVPQDAGVRSESGSPAGSPERPRTFDPAEDAHALWELAVAGHEARAYAGLVELFRRRSEQADLPLRLYWLLALNPELDLERDPCTWLVDALRLSRLAGPAAELIRRELDERPAEALAAGEPLTTMDAPTGHLGGYLAARVAAAARLRRWDVVALDLRRGRERVRPTDENSWLKLLLVILDHAAWEADGQNDAKELFADCRREVSQLGHLAVTESESFDRLEYLVQVSAGWTALASGTVPSTFLDLLPAAWTRPFPDTRPALVQLLADIADAPHNWLWHLDVVAARNKAALSFFGALLGQYEVRLASPPPVPHQPADLARLVREFLNGQQQLRYDVLRSQILTFCLREAVGAELFAAVAPPTAVGGGILSAVLANDWPLRYVCWACRLSWM